MAQPPNFPQIARNHETIPIPPSDPFTFQHDPSNPDLLNIGPFPTIPQGIYSSIPVGCDCASNPVPTGSVGGRGHGRGYLYASPLDPSCQPPFENSPESRNEFAKPATWVTTRTPLDRPPHESAEPAAASSPNGRGADQQRSMRRTDNLSFNVTPVYRCRWQGCPGQTNFRRKADLLRHLKTIHIEPEAYPCLSPNCGQSFGRKDHLKQHMMTGHV
ncbi:hypothetical protein BDW72DRAFT_198436 [Aspergillus terricola var. indicus]